MASFEAILDGRPTLNSKSPHSGITHDLVNFIGASLSLRGINETAVLFLTSINGRTAVGERKMDAIMIFLEQTGNFCFEGFACTC